MGRKQRIKPKRLADKLLQVRSALGLSQTALLRELGFEKLIDYRRISEFELGQAEPPLPVLLQYARVAGVHMEDLVDDDIDLPTNLPGPVRSQSRKHSSTARRRR